MSFENEELITLAIQLLDSHKAFIRNNIKKLKLKFSGAGKVVSKTAADIKSDVDVVNRCEEMVQLGNLVTQRTPLRYWTGLIERAIIEEKEAQLLQLAAKLRYSPAIERTEGGEGLAGHLPNLARFTALLTGKPEADIVDLAVMAHFLWQIKRKLNELEVTWHMMPIIWGLTGAGKSMALRKLMEPISGYVVVGMSLDRLGDDKYYRQFHEHLVVFFDEMPKIERASIEQMKQVITADKLTGRLLYSNSYKAYTQRCTFLGASNASPSQLIKDSTGMRRFYYLKCADKVDWDSLNKISIEDIWKEVNEGTSEPYILGVFDKLKARQEEVRVKDVLEEYIDAGYITSGEAGKDAVKFKSKEAYQLFKDFCEESGHNYPISKQSFNRQLQELHHFKKVTTGTNHDLLFPSFYGTLNRKPDGMAKGALDAKGLKDGRTK